MSLNQIDEIVNSGDIKNLCSWRRRLSNRIGNGRLAASLSNPYSWAGSSAGKALEYLIALANDELVGQGMFEDKKAKGAKVTLLRQQIAEWESIRDSLLGNT